MISVRTTGFEPAYPRFQVGSANQIPDSRPDGYHKLSEEEQDKESEKLIKKWFKIVDEMIEGFELHSTHFEWEHKEGKEKKWKKVNRGLKHFSKYYLCLWW